MKKIIKRGQAAPLEFECTRCGCIFESDEYITIEQGTKDIAKDKCPECKKRVDRNI